jgi:hypothetical protein
MRRRLFLGPVCNKEGCWGIRGNWPEETGSPSGSGYGVEEESPGSCRSGERDPHHPLS